MEDNNNSVDMSAVLSELQTLNQGVVTLSTNQKELTEYIISKDKKEQQEKAAAEKKAAADQEAADQEAADQQVADQEAADQQAAQDQQVTETYTTLLTDIRDDIRLQNQMIGGQILFTGIICGIILAKIFFDRFIRL